MKPKTCRTSQPSINDAFRHSDTGIKKMMLATEPHPNLQIPMIVDSLLRWPGALVRILVADLSLDRPVDATLVRPQKVGDRWLRQANRMKQPNHKVGLVAPADMLGKKRIEGRSLCLLVYLGFIWSRCPISL